MRIDCGRDGYPWRGRERPCDGWALLVLLLVQKMVVMSKTFVTVMVKVKVSKSKGRDRVGHCEIEERE